MNLIIEFITYIVVEIIFQNVILRLLKGLKWVGLMLLRSITLSQDSLDALNEKYKDSATPYFVGFAIVIGLVYLIYDLFLRS